MYKKNEKKAKKNDGAEDKARQIAENTLDLAQKILGADIKFLEKNIAESEDINVAQRRERKVLYNLLTELREISVSSIIESLKNIHNSDFPILEADKKALAEFIKEKPEFEKLYTPVVQSLNSIIDACQELSKKNLVYAEAIPPK